MRTQTAPIKGRKVLKGSWTDEERAAAGPQGWVAVSLFLYAQRNTRDPSHRLFLERTDGEICADATETPITGDQPDLSRVGNLNHGACAPSA